MEHELIGWVLAMHMLDALDAAMDIMEKDADWRKTILLEERKTRQAAAAALLPPPVTDVTKTGVASMLHGTVSGTDKTHWHMNHISCRTSFLPNISGDLDSIVVSGVTEVDEDMLKSRDDALFDGGWVMDVGKMERETKLKVQKYGGLGYIDMKTALYGIPSSGTLKFWLPYEGDEGSSSEVASNYFDGLVVCEVNEKRGDKECKMTSDLDFRVGGVDVPSDGVSQVKEVASYLKKDICIRVDIPNEAKVSTSVDGTGGLGLTVEVSVSGTGVTREGGACNISHVIWENKGANSR